MIYFVFNFVLITFKGILQKINVREAHTCFKERIEHEQ
jgi:hypothetical protein